MLNEPDWYKPYRSEKWYKHLKRRFFRRFAYRFADPEDAFSQSIEILWFRKLPGAKPVDMRNIDSFVNVIFDRTVIDRCRSENGRLSVPLRLKSKGPAYVELFHLHCIGQVDAARISAILELALPCVRTWIAWIEHVRACERPRLKTTDTNLDDLQSADSVDTSQSLVEQEFEIAERQAMITELLFSGDGNRRGANTALPSVALSADQILVLKMRYWEEMTLEDIATELHLKVHRVKYLHSTAIRRLRKIITKYSLDIH